MVLQIWFHNLQSHICLLFFGFCVPSLFPSWAGLLYARPSHMPFWAHNFIVSPETKPYDFRDEGLSNPSNTVGSPNQPSPNSGFLSLGIIDIWGQISLLRGSCPMHCRMGSSISDSYPPDASSNPHTHLPASHVEWSPTALSTHSVPVAGRTMVQ